ncbi:ATP-binding protein [soil metagenome]
MRFTRISVTNWKNFIHADVALAKRVFIVGPNASGKSNLLDALRFLRDLVTEGGGLAKAIDIRGGMGKVRSLYARQNTDVVLVAEVRDEEENGWLYELAFNHDSLKNQRPMVVREEAFRLGPEGAKKRVLQRPDAKDASDREQLTQTALQQVTANQDFRELASFLRDISYLHLVPQLLREEQMPRSDTVGPDPFGRDLLDRMRNTPKRTRDARLGRIEKVLRVVAAQLQELRLHIDEHGRPHLQGKFRHWRPHGAFQNETQLSDGTLRLIGLLWALQESAGPLLLEEPELSLHTAVVRQLAPFIHRAQVVGKGRQVILSTHSEDLLADEGIAPEEVLLVQPAKEGSKVIEGANQQEIVRLMQAGLPASEAVMPRTITKQMTMLDKLAV